MSFERAACRSCGAAVIWTETERGKRMPVDAEPVHDDGIAGTTFVLRAEHEPPLAVAAWPAAFPDEPHYVSHFATCPDADDWRRRASRAT
jgi:hypothetical protein